jgi:hypothetical protein
LGPLAVALAFGGVLAAGGAGLARHLVGGAGGIPLGAVVALAAAVVATGDTAAVAGFRPWLLAVFGMGALAAGWIAPRRGARPGPRPEGDPVVAVVLGATALALAAPLLVLPVPLDTDAQGFGHLALAVRDGGTLHTLAPWRPDLAYLYAPGALLVFATLSGLAPGVPMSAVMMAASHVAALLFVWLARDLGAELGDWVASPAEGGSPGEAAAARRRYGRAMTVCAALSVGLWTALMDSHYTTMFALPFALAFLTALFRFLRAARVADAAVAALALAAVVITHPDTTMIVGLGLGPFLALVWLAVDRPPAGRWLAMAAGIPGLALALVSPWLWHLLPLLGSGIESPFRVDASHWRVLVWYHGGVWPVLAGVGAAIHLWRRRAWALLMVGWLAAVVEFSTLGLLERTLPALMGALLRFDYPFSLAWHGPIVPYMVLGAAAAVWGAERAAAGAGWRGVSGRRRVGATVVVAMALALAPPLVAAGRERVRPYGAFATARDVAAMRWLRAHAPPAARVLNYPGDYERGRDWEGHWAPVVAERDCVYFRMQPFFRRAGAGEGGEVERAHAEQRAMLDFWRDPADAAHATRLRAAGIRYVLVPDAIGDPGSAARAWRWQPPAVLPGVRSAPRDAAYLRLVFRAGGAEVHAVEPGPEPDAPGRGLRP